jgi:Pentapeptide repeats (8 copies)
MANDEHVALLKQGVTAWNAWRDENPNIHPDLREADLTGADLTGADLFGATLMMDLTDADLTGCRVFGVSAWELKLERAKQQNLGHHG